MFPFGFMSLAMVLIGIWFWGRGKIDIAIPLIAIGGIIGMFNFSIHISK